MALFKMPKRADSDAHLLIHKAQEVSELKKRVKIKGTSLSAQLEAIARNVEETLGDLKENYLLITTDEEWLQYCRNAVFDEYVSIDTETTGLSFNDQKNLVGVCIQSYNQKPAYIPYGHISTITEEPVPNQVSKEAIIEGFSILHKGNTKNIFHNAYYDVVVIYLLTGIMMPIHWDTQEAGKLLNENDLHNLKFLYDKYVMCGTAGVHKFNELFEGITFCYVPYKIGYIYAAHDAEMTMELFKFQRNYLTPGTEECNQCHLERVAYEYYNTELPCLDVLIDMKIRGIDYDMELNRKLHDKYTAIREETYNRYVDVCEKIHHEINNYNRYNPPIEFPPNAGSSQQMQAVFYKILGANPPTKKKKDNHTTNKKALKNWAKNGSEIVKELASVVIELKACEKCLNDFIDKLYLTAMEYGGKIHGNFKLNGAKRTGRLSCIAEDTLITVVGGYKKIQDIKAGDLVYCYDNDGKLRIDVVERLIDNGIQPCVEVKWKSQGSSAYGSLICTPDHLLRTRQGEWKRADSFKYMERVSHLRRGQRAGRNTLYGLNSLMIQEQLVIKNEYFNCTDKDIVIHHIDGNRLNDNIENFELMPRDEHTRMHSKILARENRLDLVSFHKVRPTPKYGKDNPCYQHISKEDLEKMLMDAGGSVSKVNMDFDTFKKHCEIEGVDIKKIQGMFKRNIDDELFTKVFFECEGVAYRVTKELHIGYKKFNEYVSRLNLCYNHKIISIDKCNDKHVYDLTIRNHHNFIANELCVHNCTDPNLQQIPSKTHDIRNPFNAGKGRVLVGMDYSQQEQKVLASLANEPKMIEAFRAGRDIYSTIASIAFDLPYEDCLEKYPDGTTNEEGKNRRGQAKAITLGGETPLMLEIA